MEAIGFMNCIITGLDTGLEKKNMQQTALTDLLSKHHSFG